MERQRITIALSNGFCRMLLLYGLALLFTPQALFSSNYSVMFGLAPKEDWAVLYLVSGGLGLITLYVGSWLWFRYSIFFAATAFTLLSCILLTGALASGGTFAAFVLYGNLAIDCLLYLAGAPIYGFISKDVHQCQSEPGWMRALSNSFARALLFYGLILVLTPEARFSIAYDAMFDRAPKLFWGLLSLGSGLGCLYTVWQKSWQGYRAALWVAVACFLAFAGFFLSSNSALSGFMLFANLAIDCVLWLNGAPVYGFVSKKHLHRCED